MKNREKSVPARLLLLNKESIADLSRERQANILGGCTFTKLIEVVDEDALAGTFGTCHPMFCVNPNY